MTFQYRVNWAGTTGGAGVSVFNARLSGAALATGPQQFAANVRTLMDTVKSNIPNEVTLSFPSEVLELDTVTGQVTAFHPVTPPVSVAGGNTGGYAHASGLRVVWTTNAVLNGRRLRGATFFVPIVGNAFDASGRLLATVVTTFENAANAYVVNMENIGSAAVWSRTHGILADVESAKVPPLGSILRSRRD